MNFIKKFFQEFKDLLLSPYEPSVLQHELRKEFYNKNKEVMIDRFYINKQGRYNPVEIKDRLKHDKCIVRLNTGDYSRDQGIANLILSLILEDDPKRWEE